MGLAVDREGRGAGLADAGRGKVQVGDRVDLIGARGRLVDPLAEQRHGARVRDEQLVELPEVGGGDVAGARDRPEVISLTKLVPEIGGHRDVCGEISVVDHIRLAAMQIGRASCRERGCPYVYISVGAGALKKKEKKNKKNQ